MPRKTGYCLAMNRDEKRTRAKGLPPSIRNINGRHVLYPSEPGGGTWIALNDRNTSFALINWYSVPARVAHEPISRGIVIPSICATDSPESTDSRLSQIPLARINPFRLVGVFPTSREIAEWQWDLKRLSLKRHRWDCQQWISSGFDERMAQQVRGRTFRHASTQKSAGTLAWLRRLHRSHSPKAGPFSTCMHRHEAATVSYTEICVLPSEARVRHKCGAPCGFSEMSFQSARIQT